MKLLSQNDLELSPVVANNRMNRERNATGINSYERDIRLSPEEFLTNKASESKTVAWLDICCGKAKALIQTAQYLEAHCPDYNFHLVGIDLVGMYDPVPDNCRTVFLSTGSFFEFSTDQKFDLITCVHGLHYLGDKLEAIKKACSLLTSDGVFVANLDIQNFKSPENKNFHSEVKSWFWSSGLAYNSRTHLLSVNGNKSLNIPFRYLGADENAGPNYTGQEVVDSYYMK